MIWRKSIISKFGVRPWSRKYFELQRYGPWELNNVARAIKALEPAGGMYFSIGSQEPGKKALSDWTFIENIAYASILAANQLNQGNLDVSGEVFSI